MDMLLILMPAPVQRAVGVAVELMWLALAAAIGLYTLRLMEVAKFQDSPGLGWRMDLVYGGMVIGAAYLALVAVRRLAGYFLPAPGKPAP
jgi:TRAP-type C4-dicarboxylate transport system permease small subunit